MKRLSLEEFREKIEEYENCVRMTPDIDSFACLAPWILAAYESDQSHGTPWIWQEGENFLVFQELTIDCGCHVIMPFERQWSFASPIIGPTELGRALCLRRAMAETDIATAYISGVHRGDFLWKLLQVTFPEGFYTTQAHTERCMASLEGGREGFLARRSGHFRARIRQAERLAFERGLTCEYLPDLKMHEIPALCERLLQVENRSWKGKSGHGIGEWMAFHENLARELAAVGRLRCLFFKLGDLDVAYLFAGVAGDLLRGWQMSFDDDFRDMSLGNLAQMEIIERGAAEGLLRYDLGMPMTYKDRWSDFTDESDIVAVEIFPKNCH